jgi:hypothetical protein
VTDDDDDLQAEFSRTLDQDHMHNLAQQHNSGAVSKDPWQKPSKKQY